MKADARSFPGIILCGGQSRRMGSAKALEPFGKGRLLDHVANRIAPQVGLLMLNANDPAIGLPGVMAFADRIGGFSGPLAGIEAGLAMAASHCPEASHALFVPVDCPFLPPDLASRLAASLESDADVALAASGGQRHPVIGLWPISVADRLASWLAGGGSLKVDDFLATCKVRTIAFADIASPDGPLDPFFNINTRQDLAYARIRLTGMEP
jgi:molybdopterin-guanine dinucleotide biosynthesis protein A